MPFLIIERVLISKVDARLSGEHTGTVLRHWIFDGTHFNTFNEDYSVGIVMLGIEYAVTDAWPEFPRCQSPCR